MQLQRLLAGLGLPSPLPELEIAGVAHLAAQVQPGWLYVAWAGARADGHAFIAEALARGAVCILAQQPQPPLPVPVLLAADPRPLLAHAAARLQGDPAAHLTLIGVTGTNGKTTTTHLVESVLLAAGRRPGIIGTVGSRFAGQQEDAALTTPDAVALAALLARMRTAGVDSVAMEVSSIALDQSRVAGLRFDLAVFTNLTQDHLDYHGSMDAYLAAKAGLLKHLKAGGRAIFNRDDGALGALSAASAWGFSRRADVGAEVHLCAPAVLRTDGIQLQVQTPAGVCEIDSPLAGDFQVENLLATVAIGVALQIPLATVSAGLATAQGAPGRMQVVSRADEPRVLVDYAHTPDALAKALAAARSGLVGRLLCVFGCGGDRDPSKRAPMGRAAAVADWCVLTSDNPRREDPARIAEAVVVGLRAAGGRLQVAPSAALGGYCVEPDRRAAIARAVAAATVDDLVLVAGKGHETYQIVGTEVRELDDRVEARRALDIWRTVHLTAGGAT